MTEQLANVLLIFAYMYILQKEHGNALILIRQRPYLNYYTIV